MLKIKTLRRKSTVFATTVLLLTGSLLFSLNSHADVLAVPGDDSPRASSAITDMDLPRRGITKSQVESEYGAPTLKHPPIGDPPITRWDYDGFSVFFEYNHVLHSVVPEKPKPIYNKEELNSGY